MDIKIIAVKTEDHLREFVTLPYKIYENYPYWPGQSDEVEMILHDPQHNYPLTYIETQLFLAKQNGVVVGRISATINEVFNKRWKDNIGFFGHFECVNDQKVANALFKTVEDWIRERGKNGVIGPFNYTYYGVMGFLAKGFEKRPTVDLAYTPEYYLRLIEKNGFSETRKLYEVLAPVDEFLKNSNLYLEKLDDLITTGAYSIRTINEDNMEQELKELLDIYNDAFSEHWAFNRLPLDEWTAALQGLLPIVPKDLFTILEYKNEPIAFILPEHDENMELFVERSGLQIEEKRVKLLLIAVKNKVQSLGVGKLILAYFVKRVKEFGYEELSISWIDQENKKSLGLCQKMGGAVDKVYRVYKKEF